jgi:signal transduction histidine kinase
MLIRSIRTEMLILLLGLTTTSIAIIAYLGVNSIETAGNDAQQITAANLRSQAERFLAQLTETAAEKNDIILNGISVDASNVADYAKNIFEHPEAFARDAYWKFDEHIFMGDKGQHLNGMDDVSSLFIPNFITIDDDLKKRVELSAYLEYIFPKVLENEPNAVAIWMVGPQGESRYYPNIGLGNIAPPDERVTEEIFVATANPKNNPERKVVWIPVYDDPAEQGLMITASAPIYIKEKGFFGVLGIDVTLNTIIKNIEEYNPIENSYSFLIDKDGYSIALPAQAYKDILGRNKKENESRINLNHLTNAFGPIISKMKEGSRGFHSIIIGDKELYVAYAPLESTGFSLGIVVEKEVMLKTVSDLQKEVEDSTQRMIYFRIIPAGLLILVSAWIAGFFYIRQIIGPIKNLTETAEEISKGNLIVKSNVTSKNEIGKLASVFNQMIEDLKKSHKQIKKHTGELEKKVRERTSELTSRVDELTKMKLATQNIMDDMNEEHKQLLAAQAELQKNVADLRLMDKEKDTFISIAAHELKTPMTAIKGFAQLLENDNVMRDNQARKKYLRIIDEEILRLSKLVTEVLDLSRMDLGTMKFNIDKISLKPLVTEIIEELDQKARKKGINLLSKVQQLELETDKEKLMQILINLIDNAIKYTLKGRITVEAVPQGKSLLFKVADTGIGIPKEHHKKMFSRFYQVANPLTRQVGGSGLGLSICKEYVEALGGRIWFESVVGKGTTFYFTIPLKPDAKAKKEVKA